MSNEPYIAVAPMMDWTDRHCRYFHRLIAPHIHLFTEMVTTGALIHGDRDRFLRFHEAEQPVTLQLGGSDPVDLARCAKMGEDYGYDAINLNCGCPSDRVQSGRFGACLMKEPELVAECVAAMMDRVRIPVSVKCRIGICAPEAAKLRGRYGARDFVASRQDDDCDDFSFLNNFIEQVSKAGCQHFIIHARKAWLNGLSPKENREIPPLRYDVVRQIKAAHPQLNLVVNGGIKTIKEIQNFLLSPRKRGSHAIKQPDPRLCGESNIGFDGIMIGREAYQNPWLLAEIENAFFDNDSALSRESVARAMIPYIAEQAEKYGTPAKSITRHMIGLFHGQQGGRKWRRALSEQRPVEEALNAVNETALAA